MGLTVSPSSPVAPKRKGPIFIRKRQDLLTLLQRIKLWPSQSGTLHGIRSVALVGSHIDFVTHCGQRKRVRNSKTSKLARWIRNKWYVRPCKTCKIPAWKIEKYSVTSFQ